MAINVLLLVPNPVHLLRPLSKGRERFAAQKLFHGNLPLRDRRGDFAVDQVVIEINPLRVIVKRQAKPERIIADFGGTWKPDGVWFGYWSFCQFPFRWKQRRTDCCTLQFVVQVARSGGKFSK